MTVTIIPFLVAVAILSADDTTWTHGPEFTFKSIISGDYNMTNGHNWANYKAKMISTIACRPKTDSTLNCHFTDTKGVFVNNYTTETSTDNIQEGIKNTDSLLSDPMKFEIEFDEDGIKSYHMPKDHDYNIMIVKMIMNNMNMDVDFNEAEKYHHMEKSYMGECNTEYTVTKSQSKDEEDGEKAYKMVATSDDEKEYDIDLKKCRNLQDCTYFKPFPFASYIFEAVNDESTNINMQTYCTLITMNGDKLKTNTNVDGTIQIDDKTSITFNEENLLEVIEIKPATEPLEELSNLESSSIFAIEK